MNTRTSSPFPSATASAPRPAAASPATASPFTASPFAAVAPGAANAPGTAATAAAVPAAPEKRKSRILFALTGSIACYKACFAISKLVQAGYEVRTVATPAALQFVGNATLEGLTGQPVYSDFWQPGRAMDHIDLARWADLAIVCPATANTINRLAAGLADDAIGPLFLAWEIRKKPWWIAPAMNVVMYQNRITQASLRKLADLGARVLGTGTGALACGEEGPGRLLEPDEIVTQIQVHFSPTAPARDPRHIA
ncbi:phosphopantothenoylcysteine decarboxylase [Opitutaceae bacterium TAV5]|nr:phosphopantothenoylcysteine decarboxylase [Opitutaceae bacterium TAV5]